ncbi:MAG: hypothetical protein JSS02_03475, partial [Planctomycetes bacterium]|nr:hypothetical protein [Planctomycetota bacterium]
PYMVGDFFGGIPGSASTVVGPFVENTGTIAKQFLLEGYRQENFNGSTIIIPNQHFYGPPGGGGLASAPGVVISSGGILQTIPGLVRTDANGHATSTQPQFLALSTGQALPIGADVFDQGSQIYAVHETLNIVLPNPGESGAGLIGIPKIAENTSPMPRDRVFFNYSDFRGVPLTMTGVNVSRLTPGFEKTFFDQSASIEMRFPFASTLNNTIVADGPASAGDVQFGDISLTGKGLIYTDEELALSAGLQLALPTANALNVGLADGTRLVRIKNESVYLMPFLGGLWTPGDRFYTQGFLQFQVPANSNGVYVNNTFNGGPLTAAGSIQDVPYVFCDLGTGYWFFRNDEGSGITGFSGTVEMHYNASLGTSETVTAGAYRIGSAANSVEMLNGVIGGHLYFNQNLSVTAGYAFPFGNPTDQLFTGELRVFMNYTFGSQRFRTPPLL